MGRSISGPAGSASNGAGIQAASTVVLAGEAVQAGDLLSLGADGLAYYGLEPGAVGASLRPLSNTAPIYNGLQIPLITAATQVPASSSAFSADKLANGNIVFAWRTDPNIYYAIYKPDGTVVVPATVIENGGTPLVQRPVKVKALVAGGFAIGWSNYIGVINTPRLALYDAAGVLQGAILNVENPATSCPTIAIDIQQLANGNIIFAYGGHNGTNYQPRFSIYNTAGAVQIGNVQVDATMTATIQLANTPLGVIGITVLTGGTFVYAFGIYDGTNTLTYFRRYDTAGAALAARAAATPNSSAGNGAPFSMCSTTDGGFVISVSNSIRKFDATGTNVGSTGAGLTYGHSLTALPGGGYRVVVSGTNLNVWLFNAAGAQIGSTVTLDTGPTNSSPVYESVLSDGSILVSYTKAGNSVFTRFDANLNVIGSPSVVIAPTTGLSPVFGFGTVNPQSAIPTFALVQYGSAGVSVGVYNSYVQKLTLLGVAGASAAQGAAVPVQYLGLATMRLGFKQPYAVNNQASSPPGQKMSIVGNSALMLGVQ